MTWQSNATTAAFPLYCCDNLSPCCYSFPPLNYCCCLSYLETCHCQAVFSFRKTAARDLVCIPLISNKQNEQETILNNDDNNNMVMHNSLWIYGLTIGAICLVYGYLGKPCLLLSFEICLHRMLHRMDDITKSANCTYNLDQFVQTSFLVIWSFKGVTYPLISIHTWMRTPLLLKVP